MTKPTAAEIIYVWGEAKISSWGDCVLCDRTHAIVNHQGLCVDHFTETKYNRALLPKY